MCNRLLPGGLAEGGSTGVEIAGLTEQNTFGQ
jgi:hypothetical protein